MALPPTLTPIIIDGNAISASYVNSGSANVTKTYPFLMAVYGDAVITNNILSGVAAGGIHLNIVSGSCIVKNNYFERGSNAISAYISSNITYDQIIKDNVFDSPTVDGVNNETLIINLSANSVYDGNKNQTMYMNYMLNNSFFQGAGTTGAVATAENYSIDSAGGGPAYYNKINFFSAGAAGTKSSSFWINLSNILPKGSKLLGFKTGGYFSLIGSNLTSATIAGSIQSSLMTLGPATDANYSGSTIIDFAPAAGSLDQTILDSTPTVPMLRTQAVATLTANYSGSNISVSPGKDLLIQLSVNAIVTVTNGNTAVTLAPLLIRYRY